MRRALSILLMFLFGLGPLAVALPQSDETHLPVCCRRHGTHHCGMGEGASSDPTAVWKTPSHCPMFPDSGSATVAGNYAIAHVELRLPEIVVVPHDVRAGCVAAIASSVLIRAVRGPPASTLA